MSNREKLLNTLDDYERKIENTRMTLKKLEDKKEALYTRAVIDEMKSRKLTLSDFYKRMDFNGIKDRNEEFKEPLQTKPESVIPKNSSS